MTFEALCKLPNGTPVRLLNDRVGRMAVWHKGERAVGVLMPGDGLLLTVPCDALDLLPDGTVVQIAKVSN